MIGLAGTGSLLRLAWRRDWVMIAAVLSILFLTIFGSVAAAEGMYPDEASQVMANRAANASVAVIAMYGRVNDLTGPGIGVLKLQMIGFVILAFLVIAIVRRHTRSEEESGRFELLGGTVMGRRAPLAAAMVLAMLTSLVAGALVAAGSIGGGWERQGSLALGAATVATGLVFTAIAAMTMQLSRNTRTCSAIAYGTVLVSFVLRMFGDMNEGRPLEVLRWVSPLGWAQQVRALDGTRWWPLGIAVIAAVAFAVIADRLLAARDLDAGLLADRPGPQRSKMASAASLAWRLTRGGLIGWATIVGMMGLVMGYVLDTAADFLTPEAQEFIRRMGGVGMVSDLFITMIGTMVGLALACFGVAIVLRLRAEESAGRLEPVLATPVTRLGSFLPYIAIAALGSTALAALFGVTLAFSHAGSLGDSSPLWRDLQPIVVQLPAVWVTIAIAVAATGWLPKWAGAVSWSAIVGFIVVGELAPIFNAPDWVVKISPFGHVPKLPVEPMLWGPVVALLGVAVALAVVGFVGFRRRDIPIV